MATKKTTVKKPLKKAQTGGYTSPYGGTGANKPKSNKSAMIAGVIGSAVSAAAAAIAKRKKSPQALVDQYMQKADKAKAKGKEERYKRFAKKAARKSNMIDQTNANVERKFSEENLTDQKKYGGTKKKLVKAQTGKAVKPVVKDTTTKKSDLERMREIDMMGPRYFEEYRKLIKPAPKEKKEPVIAKKGGSTGDKKWIQKAINPKHKGYCTPMTKPTCTPKRKALAITLKKMAKNR